MFERIATSIGLSLIALGMVAGIIYVMNIQPEESINWNYKIDLQEDGYEIQDKYGKTHHVKNGDLEEFFLRDNL